MKHYLKILCLSTAICVAYNGYSQKHTTLNARNGEITSISGDLRISGIYPHLTTYAHGRTDGTYSFGNECGIGAMAVWGGKLYMVNYAAHQPWGSEHKLYIIDKDKKMSIYPKSVGGTPAARMIHAETEQLLIGHYLIDKRGNIRTIPVKNMPGRITAIARHLTNPENKVYYYDMEGMLYEANVNTLEVKKLYHNPLPGWHGKGAYTAHGKLVLANNGETQGGMEPEKDWQVPVEGVKGPEKFGVLAEYDGKNFKIIERKQFTDVTTKNGINAVPDDNSPLWAMGWDKRAIRLKVMEDGKWRTYLLPKAAYNNDPSHGWFTEWPRIREIGNGEMMMDMHGMFYEFPSTFSSKSSGGIRPISSHLRYIPDFCSWNGELVLATDEASIQGNLLTGQPQSGLWFGSKDDLYQWGPATGYGAIWLENDVEKDETSEPYLFAGFDNRQVHIINHGNTSGKITIQIDKDGTGKWKDYKTISLKPEEYKSYIFPNGMNAEWIRTVSHTDANLSVIFHYSSNRNNFKADKSLFEALADTKTDGEILNAKLYSNKRNFNLSCFTSIEKDGKSIKNGEYEFGKFSFDYVPGITEPQARHALETKVHYSKNMQFNAKAVDKNMMKNLWSIDDASVILHTSKGNLRLPKGDKCFDSIKDIRSVREVESERELANIHGTFYELPLQHVGQEPLFHMMRPVSSHDKLISDYNTWNGLLVMSGIKKSAESSIHVYKNKNNTAALWFGGIDDLWKLGKPVGKGGPWAKSDVRAGEMSDPYLMTGYDKKTLHLSADKNVTVTLWLKVSHYIDNPVKYKEFKVKAGKTFVYKFPEGFSAHWALLSANKDCNVTAQFIYE